MSLHLMITRRMGVSALQKSATFFISRSIEVQQQNVGIQLRSYAATAASGPSPNAKQNGGTPKTKKLVKSSANKESTTAAGDNTVVGSEEGSEKKTQLPTPQVKVVIDKDYDPYEGLDPKFKDPKQSLAELSGASSWKSAVVLNFMKFMRMDIEENQAAPVAGGIYMELCKSQAYHPPDAKEYGLTAVYYYRGMKYLIHVVYIASFLTGEYL